jgi:hypothetical protein
MVSLPTARRARGGTLRPLGRAPYSDMEGGLYRAWLTPAIAPRANVGAWMAEAGMAPRMDAMANLIGRYEGTRDGPPLIIASHIDSVRDGGFYDGPLGVMLGVECVAALHAGAADALPHRGHRLWRWKAAAFPPPC